MWVSLYVRVCVSKPWEIRLVCEPSASIKTKAFPIQTHAGATAAEAAAAASADSSSSSDSGSGSDAAESLRLRQQRRHLNAFRFSFCVCRLLLYGIEKGERGAHSCKQLDSCLCQSKVCLMYESICLCECAFVCNCSLGACAWSSLLLRFAVSVSVCFCFSFHSFSSIYWMLCAWVNKPNDSNFVFVCVCVCAGVCLSLFSSI